MNWRQLKEFANSLPEEKLDNNVILWREDEAIGNISAECLEEDQYIGNDDEGCYPLSEATSDVVDLRKVYTTGDPILHEIF